jgi:hypothetical protein
MDRRTVFLASIGALHVAACGGESGEANGESSQALSTISPSLLVKTIAIGGSTPGSLITMTVQVLPELFIGTITLAKGASGAATRGTFKKGKSAKLPGSADATISAEQYDYIVARNASGAKFAVALEYTTSGTILNVFVEVI